MTKLNVLDVTINVHLVLITIIVVNVLKEEIIMLLPVLVLKDNMIMKDNVFIVIANVLLALMVILV